ncbi:MAG: branched-chain amino acid ABC transporter substrate-binding protein, partial [Hyphomicrobiaceae bacterium]
GDRTSTFTTYGYSAAQSMVQILKQCGNDLTRANVMRQAAALKDVQLDMILPGIKLNTSATDFYPIEQMQLVRFTGSQWERFGQIINGEIGG